MTAPPVTTGADGFAVVPLTIEPEPVPSDYFFDYNFDSDYYDDGPPRGTRIPDVGLSVIATTPSGSRVFTQLQFADHSADDEDSSDRHSFVQATVRSDRMVAAPGAAPRPVWPRCPWQ